MGPPRIRLDAPGQMNDAQPSAVHQERDIVPVLSSSVRQRDAPLQNVPERQFASQFSLELHRFLWCDRAPPGHPVKLPARRFPVTAGLCSAARNQRYRSWAGGA